MSFCKTNFVVRGNLTKDAEIRQAGKLYAVNLDVAVAERIYDAKTKEWKNSDPAYYRVTKFVQSKDYFSKSAVKGAPILATGEIRQRIWENKEGKKQLSYDFIADNLEFLVRPAKSEKAEEPVSEMPVDTADIPF